MMRVALLSKWHVHATDYLREATQHPGIQVVKVWDEDEDRGRTWAKDIDVPFEADLDAVLSDTNIDAVIVTTPTHLHKDVIIRAANHGKHIFTEKVLAFSEADVEEIFAVVDHAGVRLMLSLPRLTHRYYLYAQQVVDQGLLGRVNTVRCRLAHNGAIATQENPSGWLPQRFFDKEACGGGALIDLGAHPIYLANRLAGTPVSVSAVLGGVLGLTVDDHSAVIVQYESDAIGLLEAGFSSTGSPFVLEIHGTEGTLLIEDDHIHLRLAGDSAWTTPTNVPPADLMPMEQWVAWIEHGTEPTITRRDMRLLTRINEAASTSHTTGRRVTL